MVWDGIKGLVDGSDRFGNSLTGFESSMKIVSAVPITKATSIVTSTATRSLSVGAGTKMAAKGGTSVLSAGDALRIENAATRIGKPITVVGSRATSGRVSNGVNTLTGNISDWDYIIQGGLKNSREWSKIKNSLPGAKSVMDNTPSMIDIHKGPVWPEYPSITIYPR